MRNSFFKPIALQPVALGIALIASSAISTPVAALVSIDMEEGIAQPTYDPSSETASTFKPAPYPYPYPSTPAGYINYPGYITHPGSQCRPTENQNFSTWDTSYDTSPGGGSAVCPLPQPYYANYRSKVYARVYDPATNDSVNCCITATNSISSIKSTTCKKTPEHTSGTRSLYFYSPGFYKYGTAAMTCDIPKRTGYSKPGQILLYRDYAR